MDCASSRPKPLHGASLTDRQRAVLKAVARGSRCRNGSRNSHEMSRTLEPVQLAEVTSPAVSQTVRTRTLRGRSSTSRDVSPSNSPLATQAVVGGASPAQVSGVSLSSSQTDHAQLHPLASFKSTTLLLARAEPPPEVGLLSAVESLLEGRAWREARRTYEEVDGDTEEAASQGRVEEETNESLEAPVQDLVETVAATAAIHSLAERTELDVAATGDARVAALRVAAALKLAEKEAADREEEESAATRRLRAAEDAKRVASHAAVRAEAAAQCAAEQARAAKAAAAADENTLRATIQEVQASRRWAEMEGRKRAAEAASLLQARSLMYDSN